MDWDVRDFDVLDGFIGPRSPTRFFYMYLLEILASFGSGTSLFYTL